MNVGTPLARCKAVQPISRRETLIMKLYYSPGACSLADHIAMHEADLTFDRIRVDLKSKETETGEQFSQINPKGYVPTLEMDDGQRLTENIAILSWIAQRKPALAPQGAAGNT